MGRLEAPETGREGTQMRRVAAVLMAATVAIVGCTESPAPTNSEAGNKPVAGGRIVDGFSSDIKTLQPVLSSDTASSGVWAWIYLSLTRNDPDTGQVVGRLAEKYDLSSDGLTLTYTLRDNLAWSDGTPFTGDDYKYTAEAVMRSKKTIRKGTFDNVVGAKDYADGKTDGIAGIQVSNAGKTVTIKFSKVFCPAVNQMGGAGAGGIIPKHLFTKHWDSKTTDTTKNIDDNPMNMEPAASMGPFVFREYKPGDHVTLVRNDRYYGGAPLIEEYYVKFYADSTAVTNALRTGEVSYSGVEAKDWDDLLKVDTLKSFKFPSFSNGYIGWNPNNAKAPWLASREVRQALWYGLNVNQIIEKVLFGHGKSVYANTLPTMWAYDDSGLTKYGYDQKKAKELLEKAGAKMGSDGVYRWTDGQPIKMKIETNSDSNTRSTILQIAQEQYGLIGVKIEPLLESFQALTERTRFGKPDWEGVILGISYGTDPDPYGVWHSSQATSTGLNRVGWKMGDEVITAQRDGPDCSQAARKKLITQHDKLLNQEAPWTFLYNADNLVFANKQIQNFDPKPFSSGSAWNIENWWIKR
jgi:peptide/nickel transport system substrate-binding protein